MIDIPWYAQHAAVLKLLPHWSACLGRKKFMKQTLSFSWHWFSIHQGPGVWLAWLMMIWEFAQASKFSIHFGQIWPKLNDWVVAMWIFWEQRNTPHSNQVAMDTAYHTRFGWVWQFREAQCQKRSVDAIYWPSIMGNFGLFPVLTQEKLDGLALQPMLGNDLQLKHVAEELPLLHHSLPITGFAVGLRRSWSYYAIFVFFLWYCPGLLIPGWTETWDRDGPEERSPGLSGSQLARVRSLPSGLVRSPAPNCHGIAECLHSLSSDHRLGLAKPNLLADEYNRFLSTQCTL